MTVSASNFVDLNPLTLDPLYDDYCVWLVVIINGTNYVATSIRAEENAHGFTNTADITMPISSNPDFSTTLADAAAASAGNSSPSVYVEIWAGLFDEPQYENTSTAGMMRVFLGVIEDYDPDFNADSITFNCRSIAADLADTKITQLILNEVAATTFLQQQAARVGLQNLSPSPPIPNAITIRQVLGKELIGGASFTTTAYRKSAADLLIQAATFDDADVWLDDDTIRYEQARNVDRGTNIPLVHGKNFVLQDGPKGKHSLRQSNNVRVDVHSFQPRTKIATRARLYLDPSGNVTKTTSSVSVSRSMPLYGSAGSVSTTTSAKGTSTTTTSSSGGSSSGNSSFSTSDSDVEKFTFYIKNADPPTCSRVATAIARQIASLEYRLSFKFPMRREYVGKLKVITAYDISGLPYDRFNDTYYARRLTHEITKDVGWVVSADTVNHTLLQGELN